ncbi:MAG TPA: ribosome maturation factor RimM [Paludibacteraceae bacterium]|nr:ribosome maturation factor RimM [Paludibacteraceae bacterium]HOU69578.1 ribosome maturation factor RimM [Paludibacteraceae bacterium]HPH63946.1 ribosome maturation factor RimM [Paludibacteraceae bacterium]HQF51239.1 ribosome maturation factor RimM [Paludibacteraceae bacterium]
MITKDEIFKIGKIIKPHGLQGELAFSFDTDIFDEVENPYFICELDGIFVPFFIESYRFKTDETALVKFEGIDNDTDAKELTNADLYMSRKFIPKDIDPLNNEGSDYYVGYHIIDKEGNEIGEIVAIDDSTENVLFELETPEKEELLIPAQDEYIVEIDDNKRTITMNLPHGLLDLDDPTLEEA